MKIVLCLAILLTGAWQMPAQTGSPVRLALISDSAEAATVAAVLTAELSKQQNLQLLERDEIEKITREQGLSGANKDYLKLGQVLGADGLLLLEKNKDAGGDFLRVQLVAVKPGVLLSSVRFAWPLAKPAEWAAALARHLTPQVPKLGVLLKDAIPISVVNLRSAIQSSEARELERQLTLLAIERLSREPQLFVLERRRMQSLVAEKKLAGLDDTAFWNGSWLLDGTLDNTGYSPDTITLSARLGPPKGGMPVSIEVRGSRTNLSEVINRLVEKISTTLKPEAVPVEWNAADEANQFFAEAQWALKWGLYPQAQTAAESAWALGRKTQDMASLLIHTYADSVPEDGLGSSSELNLRVLQIPDASSFAPLDRGLEIFDQSQALLFGGTNTTRSCQLGLRLLRPAFGLLESYYYAAEMRASHAEELVSLREKIRRALAVMDAHPLFETNSLGSWNNPQTIYAKLKWNEGGICFEHPEAALDFYRNLLKSGARPEILPRIIGWSWADRQRVPGVLRRLVDEAGASPRPAVRLAGLFLAVLLAPDDELGSLRRSEESLESAMWEYRAELYRSKETIALVECTRQALAKKLGEDDIYHVFSHEPFASFKHRLRLDFLTQATDANVAVVEELFPNTNVKMETPEQARELLPIMEGMLQRLSRPNRFSYKLRNLRENAGVAIPPSIATRPTVATAGLVEAKFIPWKLVRTGVSADSQPQFSGMVLRNGRLWVRVSYRQPSGQTAADAPTSYLAVDPQRGVQEEIIFPDKFDRPGSLFEVSSNALFVEAGGRLFEYKFRTKTWLDLSVPMEGSTKLVWQQNRLFIGRSDGLLAVLPDSKQVQLLVSARRTPPANDLDPLWTSRAQIYPQADGGLGVLAEDHCFTFDPGSGNSLIRALPLTGTNKYFSLTADYVSVGGSQRLLTGPFDRRYLVGCWNNGRPVESLLMEETGISVKSPPAEKLLLPIRWDWPQNYPMEHSQIVAGDDQLWVLSPRKIGSVLRLTEPVAFNDDRTSTLFYFTPDSRQPLTAAIHFSTNGLLEMPLVSGHVTDLLDPIMFGYMSIFQRLSYHVGNMAFWLRTPTGLVFGGRNYGGHWIITDADLERTFKPQRETLPSKMKP